MRNLLVLVLLAGCTPQIDVTRPEDAPTGAVLVPTDGASVPAGRIELRGQVSDLGTDAAHLYVVWSVGTETSDADATWRDVCVGFALADGSTLCVAELTPSDSRIRMIVTDLAGFQHTERVEVSVVAVEAPVVTLLAPTADRLAWSDVPVALSAEVDDADDAPETLTATWDDSVAGRIEGPAHPDAAGRLQGAVSLALGVHQLTLTVTDPGGASATARVTFEVADNHDPVAIVEGPAAGGLVLGAPVDLVGRALDPDVEPDRLAYTWTSDRDGVLGSGTPGDHGTADVEGVVLSAGAHLLTLSVDDDGGRTATAGVSVSVEALPVVTWTSPTDGATFDVDAGLLLTGLVTDDVSGPSDLVLTVLDDGHPLAGVTRNPDAEGDVAIALALAPGDHTLTLTVTDAAGLSDVQVRHVTGVVDP